jgi:hypothetical protein
MSDAPMRRARSGLIGGLLSGAAAPGIYVLGVFGVNLIFGDNMGVDDAFFAWAVLLPVVVLAGMSAVFATLCLGYGAFWFARYLAARQRS